MVCSSANVTSPMLTVSTALSPSAMVSADSARPKSGWSLAGMEMVAAPTGAES